MVEEYEGLEHVGYEACCEEWEECVREVVDEED